MFEDLIVLESPGKALQVRRVLGLLNLNQYGLLATAGHFCAYPASLYPFGACVVESDTRLVVDEFARTFDPARAEKLLTGFRAINHVNGRILIGADDDAEGDAIAYDIMRLALASGTPEHRLFRLRLQGLDKVSIKASLSALEPVKAPRMTQLAAPARVRAFLDRMIGAAWSKPGAPAGRIFTALLASIRNPQVMEQIPAGEIRLTCAAFDQGQMFHAVVPITQGARSNALLRLAAIVKDGLPIPGKVRRPASLSAGVPDYRVSQPAFNMTSLVIAAGRQYGLSANDSYQALQRLHMKGLMSYPRTENCDLGNGAIEHTAHLAFAAGVQNFDMKSPCFTGNDNLDPQGHVYGHSGLHVLAGSLDSEMRQTIAAIVIDPELPRPQMSDRNERLVLALVARRAIGAGIAHRVEKGFHVANDNMDAELSEILADVEWYREIYPRPAWDRAHDSGVYPYPADTQIIDLAVRQKLGKPSTLVTHVQRLLNPLSLTQEPPVTIDRPDGLAGRMGLTKAGRACLKQAALPLLASRFAHEIEDLARRFANVDGVEMDEMLGLAVIASEKLIDRLYEEKAIEASKANVMIENHDPALSDPMFTPENMEMTKLYPAPERGLQQLLSLMKPVPAIEPEIISNDDPDEGRMRMAV